MKKILKVLNAQREEFESADIHFTADHIFNTANLNAVISIYENIKPANMVLSELTDWAKINNPEVAQLIADLQEDMSWSPPFDADAEVKPTEVTETTVNGRRRWDFK